MAPRSWQNRLKDAFSGLNIPSESPQPRSPPGPLPGYSSPPQPYHYQSSPPLPPRPSPPIPQRPSPPVPRRPSGIFLRALRLLDLPIIEAELVLPTGQVVLKRHNLDSDLGNEGGTFSFGGRHFSKSARAVYLHDATLYAELATREGKWYPDKVGIEVDIPQDLRLVDIAIRTVEYNISHSPNVPNERSRLAVGPQEDVHSLRLISNFVLAAECRQADFTYATSYVNLDDYLSNDHGVFKRDGRHFSATASNVRLASTTLYAELGDNRQVTQSNIQWRTTVFMSILSLDTS